MEEFLIIYNFFFLSSFHLLGVGIHHKVHQALEVCRAQCRTAAPEVLHHSPVSGPVRAINGCGDQRHKGQGE